MKNISRRKSIKAMGLLGLGLGADSKIISSKNYLPDYAFGKEKTGRKLTAITCGAGARGNTYGGYALKFPEELDIVGVAEPIEIRRARYSEKHNIPKENQFHTWEEFFDKPKMADICIITTPDDLHYGPAMAALEKGYDLLLEKPIAQTWKECHDILKLQKEKDAIVAVCHVLRYSPYYRKIKEVLDEKRLGELVSVQHFEPIQYVHMAHSFVRGNWRRKEDTNPIILAKSCHDMDMLRWWIDRKCEYVSSFGSLKWFKESNAPEGSTARCTDGCAIESSCPYSAKRIYFDERTWLYVFDLPEEKEKQGAAIMENLKTGPYGRCVYRCDNNVADHQIVNMQFKDDITASFSMEAFTDYWGRRTRIMGTMGCIVGDEQDLYISDFKTKEIEHWITKEHADITSGHGGGDYGLVSDFLNAVDKQDENLLSSNLESSMESHLMAFQAEESRLDLTVKKIDLDL